MLLFRIRIKMVYLFIFFAYIGIKLELIMFVNIINDFFFKKTYYCSINFKFKIFLIKKAGISPAF